MLVMDHMFMEISIIIQLIKNPVGANEVLKTIDLNSNILIAIPLFILYEVSIVIARLGYRKFLVAEQKRMAEEKVEEQNNQVEALLAEQRKQMEQLNN